MTFEGNFFRRKAKKQTEQKCQYNIPFRNGNSYGNFTYSRSAAFNFKLKPDNGKFEPNNAKFELDHVKLKLAIARLGKVCT